LFEAEKTKNATFLLEGFRIHALKIFSMMGLHAPRMAIENLFQLKCLSSTCNSTVLICVLWDSLCGSDACVSSQKYMQNPVRTALDTLLPCAILATANHTYLQARISIDTVIRIVCLLGFFPFYFA
jgi:hypothetical protein